jgi:hypothetical protein
MHLTFGDGLLDSLEERRGGALARPRTLIQRTTGQALVEFTLSATVLLLLLFGAIQLAIIGGAALSVTQYAYAGVRYASINGATCSNPPCSTSSLGSTIKSSVSPSPFINDSGLSTPSVSPGTVSSGQQITVTVTYNLSTGQKLFLPSMFGISLPTTLSSSESMLVQ